MFSHCVIYVEAEERRKHGFSVDSALHILVTHVGFPGEIQEDSLTLLLLFREEKSIAAAGLCRRRSKRKEDLNNPLPLPSGITHHYLHNTLSLVALCVCIQCNLQETQKTSEKKKWGLNGRNWTVDAEPTGKLTISRLYSKGLLTVSRRRCSIFQRYERPF